VRDTRDAQILSEVLPWLRGPVVHLENYRSRLTVGQLAQLPALDRLRKLVIDCEDITGGEVRLLVESSRFTKLQSFHFRCPRLNSRHLEGLAEMPFPSSLRRLSINSHLVDDAGLAALLRSSNLQRLSLLNLRECHVGHRTLEVLAESPMLPRLRELILPIG